MGLHDGLWFLKKQFMLMEMQNLKVSGCRSCPKNGFLIRYHMACVEEIEMGADPKMKHSSKQNS